ncbi:MAG TPA: hypothetical protein ENH62_12665 [Marinobacter sp.]|nr:hypothetical protein [Marinobacter sp.]
MAENFTHPLRRGEKIGTTATDRLRASVDNLRNENARLRAAQEAEHDECLMWENTAHAAEAERDALQARVEEAERNLETHLLGYSPYRAELDRYKALAERRKKALEEIRDCPWTSFAFVNEIRRIARAAIEEEVHPE